MASFTVNCRGQRLKSHTQLTAHILNLMIQFLPHNPGNHQQLCSAVSEGLLASCHRH